VLEEDEAIADGASDSIDAEDSDELGASESISNGASKLIDAEDSDELGTMESIADGASDSIDVEDSEDVDSILFQRHFVNANDASETINDLEESEIEETKLI
jgi:hypothetical protein